MSVSRETISPWVTTCENLRKTLFYKHLFLSNSLSTLNKCSLGAVELLFAVNTFQSKEGFVLIAENKADAESVFLGLGDFFPTRVFFAPNNKDQQEKLDFFVSEDDRNFEAAFAATLKNNHSVIVSTKAALDRPVRRLDKNQRQLLFDVGGSGSLNGSVKTLSNWNYDSVDTTTTPGSYALRGGILDIFPLYATRPTRVEYFGNTVDSIREFNPISQLSISNKKNFVLYAPSGYKSENKILFGDVLESVFNRFYYMKKGAKDYALSNSSLFDGDQLSADCYPYSRGDVFKNPHLKPIVFGDGFSKQLLRKEGVLGALMVNKPLRSGFTSEDMGLAILGYKDLNAYKPIFSTDTVEPFSQRQNIRKFEWGDYVVHEDYGIGVYKGLSFVGKKKNQKDSVVIEFFGGDVIHVSVDRLDKIHRYISPKNGVIKLSSLGTKTWKGKVARAEKSTDRIIEELVALYSFRQQPRGYSYVSDNELVGTLADSFPFEETVDQKKAIEDVLKDLDKPCPMDRVILGDVGFGKTEVAIRGSMKAIASGRQVFFMAPTTVLADQHFITAKNRLGNLGVNIDLLSRFQKKKEQKIVLEKIKNKKTDIIIGTHRLMSDDVVTDNLGLLIIDEEHRFGVKHKDRIRLLKKEVDVLTLTATPIPRTLQQSLVGVRDISRIDTPPKERLPIKTTVQYSNWDSVYLQIKREIDRGGQIYFLQNDIRSIPFVVEKIKKRFPLCVVGGAHGSMSSNRLEKTVLAFFNGDVDILVCTTIIESGLDVTNANTVIINNAHRLGLAQLYQIRGRVGRGNRQAYCWLMVPNKKLNDGARRRLKAIEHYSALGSGYQIALKDLEIRGAGSLFGYEQSGHINGVGYDLYCKILKKRLDRTVGLGIKENKNMLVPAVSFRGSAYLSRSYVLLAEDRIYYYQRLATARSVDTVVKVQNEITDRFGPLEREAENLIIIAKIRESLTSCGVKKVSVYKKLLGLTFSVVKNDFMFSAEKIQKHMTLVGRNFRFNNNEAFQIFVETKSHKDSLSFVSRFAEWVQTDILS